MEQRILLNRIRTPDKTVLTSFHRHDYVTHLDKNGETYMVDGGSGNGCYLRRSLNIIPYEELSVHDDGTHETRRENLHWGVNYTKEMARSPQTEYRPIKDLSTGHIEAILHNYGEVISEFYKEVFIQELSYRRLKDK